MWTIMYVVIWCGYLEWPLVVVIVIVGMYVCGNWIIVFGNLEFLKLAIMFLV